MSWPALCRIGQRLVIMLAAVHLWRSPQATLRRPIRWRALSPVAGLAIGTALAGCSVSTNAVPGSPSPPPPTAAASSTTGWAVDVDWGGLDTPGMAEGVPNPAGWYQAAFGQRTTEKVLYLTFDDGPTPGVTDAIIDALADHEAIGTFFVLGTAVKQNPSYVQKVASAGHAIGDHTMTHPELTKLPKSTVRTELAGVQDLVGNAMGPCMRPPYGLIDDKVAAVSRELGLMPILWTGHAEDWNEHSVSESMEMLKVATSPGAVILLHDTVGKDTTVETLRKMLPWWSSQGYRFEPVPACLNSN